MKEELELALALLGDIQEELAFEDVMFNGALSQSIFDKLARVSNIMEKMYSSARYGEDQRKELDFNDDSDEVSVENEEGWD